MKFRPGYPVELLTTLEKYHCFTERTIVADIGCGPGILSRLFLGNGNSVFCVDPNEEMLRTARHYLSGFGNATFMYGYAERTSIPDHSVDLISVGQAFHWFDPAGTRVEFRRILRNSGLVALVWNERNDTAGSFNSEYERICRKYSPKYHKSGSRSFADSDPNEFFISKPEYYQFENTKSLDYEAVLGRYASASYAITERDRKYRDMIAEFMEAFGEYEVGGLVELVYTTKVYVGKI